MEDHSTNVAPLQDSGEIPTTRSGLITGQNTSQVMNQSFPSLGQSFTIKLDHNNFLIYRFDDILDETRPCPPHILPYPNYTSATTIKSLHQNQLVMSWIYSSLTKPMMTQIMSYNIAHKIWESLQRSFASAYQAHIMDLRLHLQTICKDGLSMLDYML
ncbi:hypothetical protein PVL29_018485 [Vitis rotundifolia]|uniref:Uncharacterized protein n=1 Tax=Vitis rotundifolia TaxID=103349 RepID=A0AA39DFY5_VITRO|nr:hypothetical protein PVL29_018485 [Vitis rotundifolia]